MESIGFRNVEVKRKERSFIYDSVEAVKSKNNTLLELLKYLKKGRDMTLFKFLGPKLIFLSKGASYLFCKPNREHDILVIIKTVKIITTF